MKLFLSIKWKSIILLSTISIAILASVVFYTINKTHTSFEQQRLEQFQFNKELLIKLLSNKQASLTQISELTENLIYTSNYSPSSQSKEAHISKVWEILNEQMDILFLEIWKSPKKALVQFSELENDPGQETFRKTLSAYVNQAVTKGETQSFLHCNEDCIFFNIDPITHGDDIHAMITGKSLANEFFLFHQAINENAGIIRQSSSNRSPHISKDRIINNWEIDIMAITEYESSIQLLQSISKLFPDLTKVEEKMIGFEGKYISIAILETGLTALDDTSFQMQKVNFIILNDESEKYLQLKKNVKDIILTGLLIWLISELILYFAMNTSVQRLTNLSNSLKLLAQEKFEDAKNSINTKKSSHVIDEFDELEHTEIKLTNRLQSLNLTNKTFKSSIENQLSQINRSMAFSQRVINESSSYILIQDKNMDIVLINTKLKQLIDTEDNIIHHKQPIISKDSSLYKDISFHNLCSEKTYPKNFDKQIHKLLDKELNFYKHDAVFYDTKKNSNIHISWSHVLVEDENGDPLILSEGSDLTERVNAENKLLWMAYHDTLTGLQNRTAFHEALKQITTRKHNALILYIDINRFKSINDLFGQQTGDAVLSATADHLKKLTRVNDGIFRLAADEFAVILYRIDIKAVKKIIVKFSNELQMDFDLNSIVTPQISVQQEQSVQNFIHYDCSIGGLLTGNMNQAEDILGKLVYALFLAKKEEGTLWYLYDNNDDHLQVIKRENYVAQKIHYALEHDFIQLLFQPIWNIEKEIISHYEVLTRIVFDDGEKLFPDEFIQVAERNSMIHQLDDYIMGKAFKILSKKIETDPDLCFSINVSAPTLQQSNYDTIVTNQLNRHNIPAENVTLEVTETSVISNFGLAVENLEKLVDKGVSIALDDFGVGFTSINYLREMPLAYVKLDGLYIKNLVENYEDEIFVKSITEMAKAYGLKVIAEYVENEAILNKLKDLKVSNAQGYFIGKPESYFLQKNFNPNSQ